MSEHENGQSVGAMVEPSPLVELLRVALPAVVTMTSYTVMQFVDTLVVSRLGPEEVAAAGNGGMAAFVPAAVMFGVTGVISTFVSQHYGAGRPERGAAYAWNGLWMGLVMWVVVLLPFCAILPWAYELMRSVVGVEVDPRVAVLESAYGRVVLAGMIFTISARGLSHFFYGLHRPRVVMVSALIANALNVPVSIALVFGWFGLPEMGVAGAAVGTVIGSFVELMIPLALFLSPRYNRLFGTRGAWRPNLSNMREIWKIGWPAGAMFGNEIVCWWIFMSGLVANFGVAHNTAGWITLRYMHLGFMPAMGLSIAVTAVVGRQIGRGRRDLVAPRTWLALKIAMAYMGVCALGFVVFRRPMVAFFSPESASPETYAEVIRIGSHLLILAAAFQLFDAMALTISGSLRGAGDTVWPGVATVILSWTFIIGVGKALVVWAPGLQSLGPWIGAASYITVLSLVLLWRFLGGAWKRIELVEAPATAAIGGEGVMAELPGIDVPDIEEGERVEEAGVV